MKGRRGLEGAQTGVVPDMSAPVATNGVRVMAAAKRRKRGGAVAADHGGKVEGKMPVKRLDKPKRARGGEVKDTWGGGRPPQLVAKADSQFDDMMKSRQDRTATNAPSPKTADKAMRTIEKRLRKRGGSVGADKRPLTNAAREYATRDHKTTDAIG